MLLAALERHREEEERQRKLADQRAGVIATAVYGAQGVTKKGGGEWRPRDFFQSLRPVRSPTQSAADMEAAVVACNKALGGHDLRQRAG